MRPSYVILFFSVCIFSCNTQQEGLVTENPHQNTTILSKAKCDSCLEISHYKFSKRLQQSLKLDSLNYTKDTFRFRFWRVSQAIDIWTTDYKSFGGVVTSFYEKYKELKIGESPYERKIKTVKQYHDIASVQAEQVYNLINKYQLIKLPDEGDIEGWGMGFDGFSYVIETSTSSGYNFKTYWSPDAQDSTLIEARKIIDFEKDLEELLSLEKLMIEFSKSLPEGNYHISGTNLSTIISK